MRFLFLGLILLGGCSGLVQDCSQQGKGIVATHPGLVHDLYVLGADSLLVGTNNRSVWPAAAKKLSKVGYMPVLNESSIRALNPKTILVTEQAGPVAILKKLRCTEVKLLKAPTSREQQLTNLTTLAEVTRRDARDRVEQIQTDFRRLDTLRKACSSLPRVLLVYTEQDQQFVLGTQSKANYLFKELRARNASNSDVSVLLTDKLRKAARPEAIIIVGRKEKTNNQNEYVFSGLHLYGYNSATASDLIRLIRQLHPELTAR